MTARSMDSASPVLTRIRKLHVDVLPQASEAVQLTVVSPGGNREPDGGAQTMLTGPEQLSVALTVKTATAPLELAHPMRMSAGQWISGGVLS